MTNTDINGMTREQLLAHIEMMKAAMKGKLSIKVSPKGAVQINGFGKWPVTLYKEQILRLLDGDQQIRDFIAAHDSELSVKA